MSPVPKNPLALFRLLLGVIAAHEGGRDFSRCNVKTGCWRSTSLVYARRGFHTQLQRRTCKTVYEHLTLRFCRHRPYAHREGTDSPEFCGDTAIVTYPSLCMWQSLKQRPWPRAAGGGFLRCASPRTRQGLGCTCTNDTGAASRASAEPRWGPRGPG